MQDRLTVQIDDWKIVQTRTFMNCVQWWIYHDDKLITHRTGKHMTESQLRAILTKEMEDHSDGRNTDHQQSTEGAE